MTYFNNDSLSMELDLYLPQKIGGDTSPLVIYVHGGGFAGGKRQSGHAFAMSVKENGMACATITYTLYMKGKSFSCDGITSEKVKAMQIAASQLWHATAYLLERSDELRIDPSKVLIAGSSAGAETVLHAAYWDRNEMQLFGKALSDEFKYIGIISGAGAIMDLNMIKENNALPTMFFHGDADQLVPYATAAHHYCEPSATGWLMFFGSKSIHDHLTRLSVSSQLITFQGGGHEHAGTFFNQDQEIVIEFVESVLAGKDFSIHQKIID